MRSSILFALRIDAGVTSIEYALIASSISVVIIMAAVLARQPMPWPAAQTARLL
jgi:Flp pilus assembly pilin Flp